MAPKFDEVLSVNPFTPEFVEKAQIIAVILKMLANSFAPSGAKELAALSEVEVALRSCNGTTFVEIFNSHAQES